MDKNSFYNLHLFITEPIFIISQSTAADAHSSVNESDQNTNTKFSILNFDNVIKVCNLYCLYENDTANIA